MHLRHPRRAVDRSKFKPAIESLETRQLLSAYFVDTDSAYAALNSKNFAAGDVVLLKGGATFHGMLYLDSSDGGTAANPLTIGSYDAATGLQLSSAAPASARATIAAGNSDGLFAYNVGGLTLTSLNVSGSGATSNTGSGLDFYSDLPSSMKLDGVTIDHVDVSGFGSYGIALGSGNGGGYANARITYVAAHDNGLAGITTYGPFAANSGQYAHQNLYIGHVDAYNNAGFSGRSSPTGSGIVLQSVDGATIEYSTAYNNGANNTNGSGPVGIWAWESNAITIQYNEAYGNRSNGGDGGGFDLDGGVTNSVMQYNYSHDNAGSGFGLYEFTGAGKWENNVVRYNVSSNNGLHNNDAEISFWTAGAAINNAQVYGNTLVVSSADEAIKLPSSNVVAQLWDNTIQIGGVVNTAGVGLTPVVTTPVIETPAPEPVVTPTPVTTPVETPAPSAHLH